MTRAVARAFAWIEGRAYGASTELVYAEGRVTTSRQHDAVHDLHLERALVYARRARACTDSVCVSLSRQIAAEIVRAQEADVLEDDDVVVAGQHVLAAHAETKAIAGGIERAVTGRTS